MALAILGILFILMGVVTIVSLVLLFIKNGKFVQNKVLFTFIGLWSMLVARMQWGSLPVNYILERNIAIAVGLIPVVAIALMFIKPEKEKYARIIMAVALVASSAILYL